MHLIDPEFKKNRSAHFERSFFVLGFIAAVLLALGKVDGGSVLGAVGISSVGASCFIVLVSMQPSGSPRNLLLGYAIGILIGGSLHLCFRFLLAYLSLAHYPAAVACASISIGVTSFLMAITDSQHPPCAGLSLTLTLEHWNLHIVTVVYLAVILLALISRLSKQPFSE